MTLDKLMKLPNGHNAMDIYRQNDDKGSADTMADSQFDRSVTETRSSSYPGKRTRTKTKNIGFVDITKAQLSSDDDDIAERPGNAKRRRLAQGRISFPTAAHNSQGSQFGNELSTQFHTLSTSDEADSQSDSSPVQRRGIRPTRGASSAIATGRTTRSSNRTLAAKPALKDADNGDSDADELAGGEGVESEDSAIVYIRRRTRRRPQPSKNTHSRSESTDRKGRSLRAMSTDSSSSSEGPEPVRRSGRSHTIKNMREQDMAEEIYADDVPVTSAPRAISVREVFQPISKHTKFGALHRKDCDVCGGTWNKSKKGTSPLIYCQGCSSSIHKACLGNRVNREHMITKIGHENFVMQCRRCIGVARKKDTAAPRFDFCTTCN